jgi:hypothetical protein
VVTEKSKNFDILIHYLPMKTFEVRWLTMAPRIRSFLRKNILFSTISQCRAYFEWRRRGFSSPSPNHVKHAVLLRNSYPNSIWIETGTFQGRTTEFLAGQGAYVYSIEPEPSLFSQASKNLSYCRNVKIIKGLSEDIFPVLLKEVSGRLNFWLDGHFSAGATHQGPQDTPILDELICISSNIGRYEGVCVFVDDIRLFPIGDEESSYPPLKFLVAWAVDNGLIWHIEHDIFIARSSRSSGKEGC